MTTISCPALFISAIASGQGKTTVTAGLARYYRQQGKKVRVFKTGPDYLDPLILEQASGHPVEQIDLWMIGELECQQLLSEAAQQADIILVEGVMGLFDGDPSGADLAERFNLPVATVIDARAMAQTFGALASGLAHYNPRLIFAGAIANVTGSQRHRELISQSMPCDIPLLACLPKHSDFVLPHRHLGLVRPNEIKDIEQRLDAIAAVIARSDLANYTIPNVNFSVAHHSEIEKANQPENVLPLLGVQIAIASDEAFSFIYAGNLRLLSALGAELQYFSPLHDTVLPCCDAIWLPGGYPELYMPELHNNKTMQLSIQQHFEKNKVIYAECGGMLYVQKSLTDLSGHTVDMLGLIAGDGVMRKKGGCQGMQSAPLPEGEIRGHAHHHSRSTNTLEAIAYGKRSKHPAPGEKIIRAKKLTASYLHLYFPSNPEAVVKLFQGDYSPTALQNK